jgi:hypothetical protein
VAVDENRHLLMSAAQDIWALGVMTFEAVTQRPSLNTADEARSCHAMCVCASCSAAASPLLHTQQTVHVEEWPCRVQAEMH